jgi:4-amino-4-deoxy-L-arabinose transferase-like glycosyltransferase
MEAGVVNSPSYQRSRVPSYTRQDPSMTRQDLGRLALLATLCWIIYGIGMSDRGLVGPDEPRYAAIAREMATSGDWVTPRLWGEPWFEKPALLYWMGALGELLGIQGDLAIRVPVALMSFAFLLAFYVLVRRVFGRQGADGAVLILATAAGWAAYSQIGVFDLPLAATTSLALVALLPWVENPQKKRLLPLFGAALGFGLLAKGLVAPAIATLAVLSVCRDRGIGPVARDLFSARTLVPFASVTLPWYGLCYWRNGAAFLEEFIWRHHVLRVFSSELQHEQPWWFYLPVILVGLAPWTPLVASAVASTDWRNDPRMRFLGAWALGTLAIFSVSTNKLPGYVLPAVPALCLIAGRELRRAPVWAWAGSGLMLCLFPIAAAVLPTALADGLPAAWPPDSTAWIPVAGFLALTICVGAAAAKGEPTIAAALVAVGATVGYWNLKSLTFNDLDAAAGSRSVWREQADVVGSTCIGDVRRHVEYGLRYYSDDRLRPCTLDPQPFALKGDPPRRVPIVDAN